MKKERIVFGWVIFFFSALGIGIYFSTLTQVEASKMMVYRYVSTTGDNAHLGTEQQPWRTIQFAAEQANAGETVIVQGGVYNEGVIFTKSGNATDGDIIFQAASAETPILDGQNSLNTGFSLSGVSYITVSGFEIRNFQGKANWELGMGIEVTQGAHHISLLNNDIHHISSNPPDPQTKAANGIGVYGTSADSVHDILIEGNRLHDLTLGWSESLTLNGNVEQFKVVRNTIYQNDNIGIDVIGHESWVEAEGVPASLNIARDGTIAENQLYAIDSTNNPVYRGEGSAPGIYVDGGMRIIIERNQVYECNFGISVGSENAGFASQEVTVRNNFIYHNDKAGLVMGGYDTTVGYATDNKIINNSFFNNGTVADDGELWIQNDVRNSEIVNNIFSADGKGIFISNWFAAPTNTTIHHNLYYSTRDPLAVQFAWDNKYIEGWEAYRTASNQDADSLFAEPLFASTILPDLHVQASSPAVDAGIVQTLVGTEDFDGQLRIAGGGIEIGADEIETMAPTPFPPTETSTPVMEQTMTPTISPTSTSTLPTMVTVQQVNLSQFDWGIWVMIVAGLLSAVIATISFFFFTKTALIF